jgi:hypothetical protein
MGRMQEGLLVFAPIIRQAPGRPVAAIAAFEWIQSPLHTTDHHRAAKGLKRIGTDREHPIAEGVTLQCGQQHIKQDILRRCHDVKMAACCKRFHPDLTDHAGRATSGNRPGVPVPFAFKKMTIVVEPARRTRWIKRFQAKANADNRFFGVSTRQWHINDRSSITHAHRPFPSSITLKTAPRLQGMPQQNTPKKMIGIGAGKASNAKRPDLDAEKSNPVQPLKKTHHPFSSFCRITPSPQRTRNQHVTASDYKRIEPPFCNVSRSRCGST